jgi:hypothetical protein
MFSSNLQIYFDIVENIKKNNVNKAVCNSGTLFSNSVKFYKNYFTEMIHRYQPILTHASNIFTQP